MELGSFFSIIIVIGALGLSLQGGLAFSSKSQPSSDLASNSSSDLGTTVWVSRSDGSQLCSADSGQSLEQGSADLRRAHIAVISKQKGQRSDDTKDQHAQGCGLPTGHVNAYEINKSDLAKANVLGYQQVK